MNVRNQLGRTHRIILAILLLSGAIFGTLGGSTIPSVGAQQASTTTPTPLESSTDDQQATPLAGDISTQPNASSATISNFTGRHQFPAMGIEVDIPEGWLTNEYQNVGFGFSFYTPDVSLEASDHVVRGAFITIFLSEPMEDPKILTPDVDTTSLMVGDWPAVWYQTSNSFNTTTTTIDVYKDDRLYRFTLQHNGADSKGGEYQIVFDLLLKTLRFIPQNGTLPLKEIPIAIQERAHTALAFPFGAGAEWEIASGGGYNNGDRHGGTGFGYARYAFDFLPADSSLEDTVLILAPTNGSLDHPQTGYDSQDEPYAHCIDISIEHLDAQNDLWLEICHLDFESYQHQGSIITKGEVLGLLANDGCDGACVTRHVHMAAFIGVKGNPWISPDTRQALPYTSDRNLTLSSRSFPDIGGENQHASTTGLFSDIGPICAPGFLAQGAGRDICGGGSTSSLYGSASSHLWELDPSTGTGTRQIPTGYTITDIAFDGNILYGINYSQLFRIDPASGARSIIGSMGYGNVNALTVASNGTMYAATVSGVFLRINKATGAGTLLGSFGSGIGSSGDLAIRSDNTMYAAVTRSGTSNNWLARININTGQATLVGDMGASGVFGLDFMDGELYGVTSNGRLLRIDPATGGSTYIQTFSASFGGLSTATGDVISLPGAATLVSPSGTISDNTPAYMWNKVSSASQYQLWVDGPSGNVINQSFEAATVCGASTCSVTPNISLASGNHTWWIRTSNSAGNGPWSSPMNFHVGTTPTMATLVSPSGAINDTTPVYSWNAVSGATYYYLWVKRPLGLPIKIWYTAAQAGCASGSGTCSVEPGTALGGGAHTWWIQTWNPSGYGPWSAGMNFSIAAVVRPGPATLVSPSGSIASSSPTYIWNRVDSATWYYLWVDGPSGNVIKQWYQSSAVCGSSTCSVTPGINLNSSSYRWWIQTWNPAGSGPWSGRMDFSIDNAGSGFNSQFNGSAAGWQAHLGFWNIASGQWYTSPGVPDDWASTSYNGNFATLDFHTRLWRNGSTLSTCLVVRGSPTPLSQGTGWDSGYFFCYSTDGDYSVWKVTEGSEWYPALQDWTFSPSFNIGAAWNVLRVIADGGDLYFYVNGTLVWAGNESSLTSGRVGVQFFSLDPSVGEQLWADWATLSTAQPFQITDTISAEQQALNDSTEKGLFNWNHVPLK
ncbi:MAG TPA: hypothetical protein VJ821_03355 [Anaerolineales bacterium]|nr:hypothetical protein [Anaerolineales bacterium]